jgi:hypothetical protein
MRSGLSGFIRSNNASAFASEAPVIFCPSNRFRQRVVTSRSFNTHRPLSLAGSCACARKLEMRLLATPHHYNWQRYCSTGAPNANRHAPRLCWHTSSDATWHARYRRNVSVPPPTLLISQGVQKTAVPIRPGAGPRTTVQKLRERHSEHFGISMQNTTPTAFGAPASF